MSVAAPLELSVPAEVLVDGEIDGTEIDAYSINLVAGQTYMFSVRGTGANPLGDTFLYVIDDTLTTAGILADDDDGGDGVNSLITYTATYTGLHYIGVGAYPGSGLTGTYTLDAIIDPGVDLVSDEFALAPDLTFNAVTFGFIESGPGPYGVNFSEVDTYKLEIEAGKIYTIEMAGGADYESDWLDLPDGELDPRLVIYDANGNLVLQNDDISFPSDINAKLSFLANVSGTFYLDAFSWSPWTGGYTIVAQEFDLADFSPLDAINWFSADNIEPVNNTATVYFAVAGETFGEPGASYGWNATEKAAIFNALEEYTKILGINYVETTDSSTATFRLITTTSTQFGAYFYPQDPTYGTQQGIGGFNVNSGGWDKPGVSTQDIPGDQVSLLQGGFAFGVILHEFGHAHGLAHPHDRGGGSDIMLGVTASTGSYGVYNLNQGVYTVMSYNDAWDFHPDGPSPFTIAGISNGWSGTLSAFDIAVLQQRYGVNNPYATGNTDYVLKDVQAIGTYYETIWDTGGIDTIRYSGNRNATIDLLAATLDYSPTGGGAMSFVDDIKGGYTIANGVVIENASGGGGNDALLGNSAANTLDGNGGNDVLIGRGGADRLNGGNGFDTASYVTATAGVVASLASNSGSAGDAAGDRYTSIEKLEGSNFADTLSGGNGGDTLSGLDGDDTLNGGNGHDTLDGGDGNDLLEGGNGVDTLSGGDGDDTVRGGNDNDTLNGNAGNDGLNGGNGNDTLNGGTGDDLLYGGNGNDLFVFTDLGGTDVIGDFRRGDDKVDVSGLGDFAWVGSGAFSGGGGAELRGYSQGGQFFLSGDADGDGDGDFLIQVNTTLTTADIILAA
ncbi:M10 family metallopeptidase C-terminal domain-containing protein [Sphingosinicella sp. LHD-64]|uniref:M10 family metallopeptidase C-terminal domain-containing protein n=1 Tax=Sphingosinicella sp. LHD-64 TaxID=3072139 RepID=UPI00280DA64E|nr:M10 family metallopeptidase C-terminal domain-containing protein [Sphingosinicella sp. LHD-64]MDQ8754817.1 M10 family metallopeptidase C-terminal domain-containing protein [Sphingosinicella sp. LHD-64]